jgi:hypothetical protein
MNPEQEILWQKIKNFNIDDGGTTFSFAQRLARENGWPTTYAEAVLAEYKKFIFLCCVSESGVTPSDQVDQAWHLHLTYTKSYWIDLCDKTLGRPIHHNPTQGGHAEHKKFGAYYTQTQMLYRNYFGSDPPPRYLAVQCGKILKNRIPSSRSE